MDVGNPSNFARILDLYGHQWTDIRKDISGAVVGDGTIMGTIRQCRAETGYLLDPHGACGYRALKDGLQDGETGFFCETAHPAKFRETVSRATGHEVDLPDRLAAFLSGTKHTIPLLAAFPAFKSFLLANGIR
jgi:threonine synthase